MPMFQTPKPRQFTYKPRFYDPERERWEALKMRHQLAAGQDGTAPGDTADIDVSDDSDLRYYEQRLREMEERKRQRGRLTWRDLFRKREMPTFHYEPRFAEPDAAASATASEQTGRRLHDYKQSHIKIKRRFDISDNDYMKPVPAGRIMLYALLACLLLYWIIF